MRFVLNLSANTSFSLVDWHQHRKNPLLIEVILVDGWWNLDVIIFDFICVVFQMFRKPVASRTSWSRTFTSRSWTFWYCVEKKNHYSEVTTNHDVPPVVERWVYFYHVGRCSLFGNTSISLLIWFCTSARILNLKSFYQIQKRKPVHISGG